MSKWLPPKNFCPLPCLAIGGIAVGMGDSHKKSVVRLSPLQLYLREIAKYPLLEPEEELRLATEHFERGDVEAAHRLITSNLRLVVKIASDFQQVQTNFLDLIQEGNYGLMQAVKKFNPYKGVKLSTYSAWWIRAYILKFIMDNRSQVKIGTTRAQRKLFFNLRKEAERLLREYDHVDPKMIASNLQVKEQEVIDMQQRIDSPDVSFESELKTMPQDDVSLDDQLATEQIRDRFRAEVNEFKVTLNDRERDILERRVLSDTPATLQELGDHHGVSRERARQLETRLVDKLRKFITSRGVVDLS